MRYRLTVYRIALVCLLLYSLTSPPSVSAVYLDAIDLVRARLEHQLRPSSRQAMAQPELARFYSNRQYQPLWLTREGLRPEATLLFRQFENCSSHGLSSDRYALPRIRKLLNQQDIHSRATLELLLTRGFDRYCQDLQTGVTSPRDMDPRQKSERPEVAPLSTLTRALQQGNFSSNLSQASPNGSGYRQLQQALNNYQELAIKGGWPRLPKDLRQLATGATHPAIPQLRIRLALTNDYRTPFVYTQVFDQALVDAIKHFQSRHGLPPHGRLDASTLKALNVPIADRIAQIRVNLERHRWGPRQLEPDHILVNMADFRLNVIEQGQPTLSMKVIIGKPYRSTPAFSQKLTHLVLNPYWYVPQSIATNDLLPRINRDPAFLARQKFRVFRTTNGQSVPVDPSTINWSTLSRNSFPFSLRQDPGPANALGRIKFVLPNPFKVFLHDTPQRHLFDRNIRTYSSGCIRLEKPMKLARYLLQRDAHPDSAIIDHALKNSTQQMVKLDKAIPVHLVYWTAWVDQNGTQQFREDVYKRNRKLRLALRN